MRIGRNKCSKFPGKNKQATSKMTIVLPGMGIPAAYSVPQIPFILGTLWPQTSLQPTNIFQKHFVTKLPWWTVAEDPRWFPTFPAVKHGVAHGAKCSERKQSAPSSSSSPSSSSWTYGNSTNEPGYTMQFDDQNSSVRPSCRLSSCSHRWMTRWSKSWCFFWRPGKRDVFDALQYHKVVTWYSFIMLYLCWLFNCSIHPPLWEKTYLSTRCVSLEMMYLESSFQL